MQLQKTLERLEVLKRSLLSNTLFKQLYLKSFIPL